MDLGASARFQLSDAVGSRTSVGGQFFRDLARGNFATGRGLPAGSGSITGAGSTEAKDTLIESRSIGSYVEEEINLKQRLFVTGALRFDDNSAFGQNFNATIYPKSSVSWLISEEPFYNVKAINTLRLRGAFGVSGQQPGTTDALRYYNAVGGKKDGIGTTGVSFASLGNANLKPERSRELEVGLDAGLFQDRVSVELTYYNKLTRDALISRDIAPSLGASPTQFVNLSRIRNRGFELAISSRIIDKPSIAWDLTVSGSITKNKILELGEGVSPIFVGFYQQHRAGYPAGGYWAPTVQFSDANGDGIVEPVRGEPERQRGLPRVGAPHQGGVAQQPARRVRRQGDSRHPVRLPRRPPGGQFPGAVPLLLGAELPRTLRRQRPAGAAGAGPGHLPPGRRQFGGVPASQGGSSSCASCRSPSRPPTAGPAPSGPAG